jgi:drug/metabolite transporter (DMT)-like permease
MRRTGIVRCLLAAVLFGASAPAASRLAGSLPAFTLAGLLYVGAALGVLPRVASHPPRPAAVRAEWRRVSIAVVAGGAVGPVLLVAGLARTSAASASILLNMELVATVIFAALLFGEHLGRQVVASAVLITIAGGLLTWQPGTSIDHGALLIVAACACWGLDNCVTAGIEQLSPEQVVVLKGVVAGGANLMIGLALDGWGRTTGPADVAAALVIGMLGYGWSIVLWVRGARDLGAARGQVIFATAPFIGATVAWTLFGASVERWQPVAVVVAAVGVAISLRSAHEHEHRHAALEHDHEHSHSDGHHDGHRHDDLDPQHDLALAGRHSHVHRHTAVVHAHPHVPDLHHRHGHG